MTTEYEQHYAILSESLQDMHGYLGRVAQGCEQITLAFQTGALDKGLDMVLQVVEGLSCLLKLTENAEVMLKTNLTHLFIKEGYSAVMLMGDINKVCGEIAQAAEVKDYTLLGDLVDYDLRDIAIHAQTMVEVFCRKLPESMVG